MNTVNLLLGDDHRIVREGLKQVLADAPEIRVVAEAQTGPEILQRIAELGGPMGLHAVLLDIALPERDGLDVLQEIKARWPQLPVLMLGTYPEKQYAVRCIQGLARSYLGNTKPVFDGVNFDIERGEFVCIIGHSGCGKTTILNVLAGLETASQGHVFMDGREVAGRRRAWPRSCATPCSAIASAPSAVDFSMDIVRQPDPKGDRVNVVLSGKFLPYRRTDHASQAEVSPTGPK